MDSGQIYEIIGYIASLLVAISLMMRSILKLRVINLIGAVFFTVYGMTIRAYPVAAVNFFIVLIDLYYLRQMLSTREFFRLLEVRPDSEYLAYFLHHYQDDIRRFQPSFSFNAHSGARIFFVLRNLVPAGLVIGEVLPGEDGGSGGERLNILLDYAIPGYRDLKIGRFVYREHASDFRERGIHEIVSDPGAPAHERYLVQMGFRPEAALGSTRYRLVL